MEEIKTFEIVVDEFQRSLLEEALRIAANEATKQSNKQAANNYLWCLADIKESFL